MISPELADVLSIIIRRVSDEDGTVPLVVAYDYHERVWNMPSPLLFQRRYAGEHRPIGGPPVRELLADALAGSGLSDASGRSLHFTPHDFRRRGLRACRCSTNLACKWDRIGVSLYGSFAIGVTIADVPGRRTPACGPKIRCGSTSIYDIHEEGNAPRLRAAASDRFAGQRLTNKNERNIQCRSLGSFHLTVALS